MLFQFFKLSTVMAYITLDLLLTVPHPLNTKAWACHHLLLLSREDRFLYKTHSTTRTLFQNSLSHHEDYTPRLTPHHHPPTLSPPHSNIPPPTRRPLHHPLLNNSHHLHPHPNLHRLRNLHPAQPPLRPLHTTSRHTSRRLRLQHLHDQPHTPARRRRL